MALSWFSCKPCSESDPVVNTVNVDPSKFAALDKENVKPLQTNDGAGKAGLDGDVRGKQQEEDKKRRQAEERAVRAAEEKARRDAEEAARLAEANAKREAEEVARIAEEELRREEQEAAELAARIAEEQERQRLHAIAAEEERKRADAERQLAEKKEAEERADAIQKATEWCKRHGFRGVNTAKKSFLGGTKFPLHTAVKNHEAEMVECLLKCGADRHAQDSQKRTPFELAQTVRANPSNGRIMVLLS